MRPALDFLLAARRQAPAHHMFRKDLLSHGTLYRLGPKEKRLRNDLDDAVSNVVFVVFGDPIGISRDERTWGFRDFD